MVDDEDIEIFSLHMDYFVRFIDEVKDKENEEIVNAFFPTFRKDIENFYHNMAGLEKLSPPEF